MHSNGRLSLSGRDRKRGGRRWFSPSFKESGSGLRLLSGRSIMQSTERTAKEAKMTWWRKKPLLFWSSIREEAAMPTQPAASTRPRQPPLTERTEAGQGGQKSTKEASR